MPRIARVVVDVALDREFDYLVSAEMDSSVKIGSRVHVPFGRTVTAGYVVGFVGQSAFSKLKDIALVIGDTPFIDEEMLKLAKWMAVYYCVSVEQAIKTVLPGPVRRKGAKAKKQMFVSLVDDKQGHKSLDFQLSYKQVRIIELLGDKGGMFLNDLLKEMGITAGPVRVLERKGLVKIAASEVRRDPFSRLTILPSHSLQLMPEQAQALKMIVACSDETQQTEAVSNGGVVDVDLGKSAESKSYPHVVLLYGVTGSGKTEVYLQAIDHVLKKGQGAIVLVPEISLTPQTVERFVSRFGGQIAVLHSHLSDGERHDEWHRINDGKANIVVGARSAVFAPVKNLGLIVVDEEHEPSYKQEEAPKYSARDVAVMRGRIERCAVVLGSATPSIESWYNVRKGKYMLSKLPIRADGRKMPVMRIIDMRIESERVGHASVFSRELLDAIKLRLERSEQTILFLNRRGFATSIICTKCGYVAECSQCSVSYTYHRNSEELRCHICGVRKSVPAKCPGCQDPAFKFTGIGTQRVESVLAKCFPHSKIQRIDADVTTSKDSYERIFGDFRTGKTNVLIGTQMIAKGLHFPNVTLVGVIYADMSLHIPDFRAGERTFQLLAQVAGRAGRGEVSGEVIVQTYTPFHTAIQAARRVDFEGFCDQETEFRRELNYPPFSHLVCITLKGMSDGKTSFCAEALLKKLKDKLSRNVIISDVTPAPLSKAKGYYRFQIIMRCSSPSRMTVPINEVVKVFRFPDGVGCSVDVDAINLM